MRSLLIIYKAMSTSEKQLIKNELLEFLKVILLIAVVAFTLFVFILVRW